MENVIDFIPNARDGLTRKERIVLYCIQQAQKEFNGRNVPTATLYGRMLDYVNMSEPELQGILLQHSSYNQGQY